MGWNSNNGNVKKNENETKETSLAYISGATIKEGEQNAYVKDASEKLLGLAKEIMGKLDENNLTTTSRKYNPQTKKADGAEYVNKAQVIVEVAMQYNKETKTEEPLYHQDENKQPLYDSPVYSARIELKNRAGTINMFAKEDMSNGAQLTNMSVSNWEKDDSGRRILKFYKNDDIAASKLPASTKDIVAYINNEGYIHDNREYTPMEKLAYDLNMHFKEVCDKVPSADQKSDDISLVNETYAKYIKDDFGERVRLANHTDPSIVELGTTSSGDNFAKITEFTDEGKVARSGFINNTADLGEMVRDIHIQEAVAAFKGIDMPKEKETSKAKEAPVKSTDEDYPFER